MRFNVVAQNFGHRLFIMLSEIQNLEGIGSLLPNGKHLVFFDLENCTLQQVIGVLMKMQISYNLSDIFIVSDKERSFRAWCYSQVDFDVYLEILGKVKRHGILDWNFYKWTVDRGYATLRTDNKKGRPTQELVFTLKTYSVPVPKKVRQIIYGTGVQKRGFTLLLKGAKAFLKWRR
jgi:hypothetical protein